MATKTTKKTATKSVAKKAPVKKTAVKATAVKKAPAKPAVATHECACGHHCKCHGGCKFGKFMKKLIIALILIGLGFGVAKFTCCENGRMAPKPKFVDGCLDVKSVKCPKMRQMLPMFDITNDGCITKEEYKAVKEEMRKFKRHERPDHFRRPERPIAAGVALD